MVVRKTEVKGKDRNLLHTSHCYQNFYCPCHD